MTIHPGTTDLLSNATRIVSEPDEDPRPWLGDIAAGTRQLLTFIHEATHNWCFHSVVVSAQLFLTARLESNAKVLCALREDPPESTRDASPRSAVLLFGSLFRAMYGDKRRGLGPELGGVIRHELEMAVADDLIRLEVTRAILRPLAEGLALFAEYDAVSRIFSKSLSPLPFAIAWNFAGRERLFSGPAVEPFTSLAIASDLVAEARLGEEAITAKASILAQPLASSAGGYLPGYLTVKNMWRNLYRENLRLYGESDIVLAYLRAFFYDDEELAAAIVAPPATSLAGLEESQNAIIGAFSRRLTAFEHVTPRDVQAFEDHLALPAAETAGRRYRPGLLRSEADSREWRELVEAAASGHAEVSWAARLYPSLLSSREGQRQRPNLIVSSVPVTITPVESAGGIALTWNEFPVLGVSREDLTAGSGEPPPAPGSAQLDILLVGFGESNGLARAAIVQQGERVVSCTVWGLPDREEEIRQQAIQEFRSRDARIQAAERFRVLADFVIAENPMLAFARAEIAGQLEPATDDLYRDWALANARDYDAIDHCAALMRKRGMYALLGSAGAVRRMALLGLAASLKSTEDYIGAAFRDHGYDLAATMKEARDCWEKYGFPRQVIVDSAAGHVILDEHATGNILVPHI